MTNTINEVIEKVKKLQRLAGCVAATPNEAALAAARAQEIIDRYKLSVDDLNGDTEFDNEEVENHDEPLDEFVHNWLISPWAVRLANIVCGFNECRIIQYVKSQSNGKTYPIRTFKIIGHPSDVALVRYLYGYLKQEVIRLDQHHCKGLDGKWRRAFCIGVTDTIYDKMYQQKQETESEVKKENVNNPAALIRITNALARLDKRKNAVDKFIGDNIKTKKARTGQCKTDEELALARIHGQAAGQEIKMTKAIASIEA